MPCHHERHGISLLDQLLKAGRLDISVRLSFNQHQLFQGKRMSTAKKRGVLSDRDGVLNEGINVNSPEQFKLIAGVKEAAAKLKAAGLPFVVVTNQGGIGENLDGSVGWKGRPLTREKLAAIHDEMNQQFGEDAQPDLIKFCPHGTKVGCECRKPKPGMLQEAAEELSLDLPRSYMIGDRASDIEAGNNAGCTSLFVLTGPDSDEQKAKLPEGTLIFASFVEAVDYILSQS
jgi:D-glycero-D-manno-heptose 1,7-bisphosphate phosphatase